MTKTIHSLIAPPGAGKTTWLLNHLEKNSEQHAVLAFPTKILSSEVEQRLTRMELNFNSINSSNVTGSVIQCLEESLSNKNDKIIICTHESLRLIKPETLNDWYLYIDEIPTTWDCETFCFSDLSYKKVFDRVVDITEENNQLRVTAKKSCKTLIEDLARTRDSTLSDKACKVLNRLLDDTYLVEIDKIDSKQNRTIRTIGVKQYTPVFEAAATTVIMGAEIEKTLLGTILKGESWAINHVEADLDFSGYGNEVVIHPFLTDKKYSKSAALMKSGKSYNVYQDDCLLDAWLKIDVFRIIGKRKAILTAHSWCQPELPVPDGKETSNIKIVPIDNRGINDYDDYTIAICLQHGNITPIESRSIPTLAKLLSVKAEVNPKEITSAIKYERFFESTLQSVCRTALRSRENNAPILLFVQDIDIANFLAARIGKCTIDETYSEVGIAPTSEAKLNRESLKQKTVTLWSEGHSSTHIATVIGKTERTVRNWLKPYRELEASG
ncbi:DEAD/DEAH box helicase family protein [Pseudomonas sichuanensis]|uniref:DEAD/DEAH box helicase family protein n=1 Tax=Pseudomonas TaxID=286 RepID=UPI0036EF0C67